MNARCSYNTAFEKKNSFLILTREPFVGYRPEYVRTWLEDHPEESNLALALTEVKVKLAGVWDVYEDFDDIWALYAADEWEELWNYILHRIENILRNEGRIDSSLPFSYMEHVIPFMKRNGYRYCSGWFAKE